MRIRITIQKEFEVGPDSIYCTEEEYRSMKEHEPEDLFEIFGDDMHDAIADWKIEEIPPRGVTA